jgi:ferredoxin--NADP+ reductase
VKDTDTATVKATPTLPDAQTVTEVQHYTDRLFRFRCTRPVSLRFRSGEFVMIGLMGDPDPKTGKVKPLLRAYSIASPSWDEELEFYSIKVPNGPLTPKLQHIEPGDQIILRPKPVGTLVHDALIPGKRIWFFATGTGFAPFASLLREPQTYEDYDEVIITHTCREVGELTYGREIIESLKEDELLNEVIGEGFWKKIKYYPTTTREESPKMGRITDLIRSGEAYADLGVTPLCPQNDRAMICGNLAFNLELKDMLEEAGLTEGANSKPAEYVVEKAFLDWIFDPNEKSPRAPTATGGFSLLCVGAYSSPRMLRACSSAAGRRSGLSRAPSSAALAARFVISARSEPSIAAMAVSKSNPSTVRASDSAGAVSAAVASTASPTVSTVSPAASAASPAASVVASTAGSAAVSAVSETASPTPSVRP